MITIEINHVMKDLYRFNVEVEKTNHDKVTVTGSADDVMIRDIEGNRHSLRGILLAIRVIRSIEVCEEKDEEPE